MDNENIFGERLKKLRIDNGFTLQNIGDHVGSSRSTIGNIERGVKPPSLAMVKAIADFFDVSIDYLIGRTDNPEVNR